MGWRWIASVFIAGMLIGGLGISIRAQSDISIPVIVNIDINPRIVDTRLSNQTVTLTAHITDDLSGLRYAVFWFGPVSVPQDQDKDVTFRELNLVSGTVTDGIYVATLELPRYSANGRWEAKYSVAKDMVGNTADCNVNAQMECSDNWASFYFLNVAEEYDEYVFLPVMLR